MLFSLKNAVRLIMPYLFLAGGVGIMGSSIFYEAKWGMALLTFLIPNPNIWYQLHAFAFGNDFLDLLCLSIFAGAIYQRKIVKISNSGLILIAFMLVNIFAACNTILTFNLPSLFDTSSVLTQDIKNYIEMIFLFFLAFFVIKDEKQSKTILCIMAVVILLVSLRSFRNFTEGSTFSYDKRVGGPFETVGLGANHYGAFIVHYSSALLGLYLCDKNRLRRWLYLAAILMGIYPLFFSYSRGAYLGAGVSVIFFGVWKKRSLLLIPLVLLLAWKVVLPESVINRITMTESSSGELEDSAAIRLGLWKHGEAVFKENPFFGVGFEGFGYTLPPGAFGGLKNSHNLYMQTLCEQGVIGTAFLLLIFVKAWFAGFTLYCKGSSDYLRGLGLGFMGCVTACIVTNLFGDRWSYFVLGGYFWILWGAVESGMRIGHPDHRETTKIESVQDSLAIS